MTFDIAGKTALVTGANRGIGRVIAETLIQHGAAKVYAAVRDPESIADQAAASGGKLHPIKLDLNKPATIQSAAESAADVQLVVNNAGVLRTAAPLDQAAEDALRYEIEVNVIGLMRMARAFAPILEANGGGAFVQLNSVASMKAFPDFATYCASKAAAYSITQSLRDVLAKQGTLVVSVHPGPIATDMGDAAGFTAIAEPPSIVADTLIQALKDASFHVFPDAMARQVGGAYASFAKHVVEAAIAEG